MGIDNQWATLVENSLGDSPLKILVTGGTGFVGASLAEVLVGAGHQVTITGRSKYRVRSSGNFVAADIESTSQVNEICQGQDIVFHTAALTSPWGSLQRHRATNTAGTQNLVDACIGNGVKRLVHVSSTAVLFDFCDRTNISDEQTYPTKFSCPYAQSKAEAEQIVQNAMDSGLSAYIVRARAVFGPGDNTLLPRLIQAARSGRLRQIGNGENLSDLTYIDNLVAGLILAAKLDGPRGTCTITNHQPVRLWDVLRDIVQETTGNSVTKTVPYWLAMRIAHLIELKHSVLGSPGEPTVTRYGVGILAKQQTFNSVAAQKELGYRPVVPLAEGIERTVKSLRKRIAPPAADQTTVTVKFYSTGFVQFKRKLAERSAPNQMSRFHATVAVIEHPVHGITLFDTGYSARFFTATQSMPYRLYRYATKVFTDSRWSIENWLQHDGIAATDVKRIVISHFHADHICGLRSFPQADYIASKKAWDSARIRTSLGAVRRAILPGLIPDDCSNRMHTIDGYNSPGLGSLAGSHDLFRDGSVRVFDLDGHADGQIGLLLQLENGRQKFLIADAFWTGEEIKRQLNPTLGFRMIADNCAAALTTRHAIIQISRSHPEIQLVCNHCPDFAAEQGFDHMLDQQLKNEAKRLS